MKILIALNNIFKECLRTKHKKRGLACIICMFICFALIISGLFYTINNFINKPINTEIKLEKSK